MQHSLLHLELHEIGTMGCNCNFMVLFHAIFRYSGTHLTQALFKK